MNGILFLDFNLPACDFLEFDCLNVDFSFNISLRILQYQSKPWKIEDVLNKTALRQTYVFYNMNNDVNIHLMMLLELERLFPNKMIFFQLQKEGFYHDLSVNYQDTRAPFLKMEF